MQSVKGNKEEDSQVLSVAHWQICSMKAVNLCSIKRLAQLRNLFISAFGLQAVNQMAAQ